MAANAVPRVRRKERPDGLLLPEGVAFLGDGQAKGGVSSPKKAAARGAGAPRAPKNGLHKLQM